MNEFAPGQAWRYRGHNGKYKIATIEFSNVVSVSPPIGHVYLIAPWAESGRIGKPIAKLLAQYTHIGDK